MAAGVTADVILDHVAEVKVDNLCDDGDFWAADAKSGASQTAIDHDQRVVS